MLDATRNALSGRWTSNPTVGEGSKLQLLLIPTDLFLSQAITDILTTLLDPQVWSDEGEGTREGMALIAGNLWDSWLQDMRPIGWILPNFLETLPDYMLPCQGQTVARADYPNLWDAIHPSMRLIGDLIQIPDMRERYLRGLDDAEGNINDMYGSDEITIVEENLPPHNHDISHGHSSPPHAHTYTQPTFGVDIESVGIPDPTGVGNPPIPFLTSAESVSISNHSGSSGDGLGASEPMLVVPRTIVVPFAIVAK